MKAVYNPHLYIWYFNFGDPGLLNNTKMLDRSSIIGAILTQKFEMKVADYSLNGRLRDYLYFLVDGIYPAWSIFVKMIVFPTKLREA